MRSVRYGVTKLWVLLSVVLCSGVVCAEDEIDPPDRVARLSFIGGAVSLAPADSDDWSDALLNRPITTGDRIWVDAGGRAEVQVGTSTVHADENTGLAFITLDDDTLLMRLTDGAVAVRVHSLERNETVQIETPNALVLLREPGEYSVVTEDRGDRTVVKTRSGEAEVTGADEGQHGYIVGANEEGSFTGGDELGSVMTQAGPRSAFETWAYEREASAEHSVAANYVPPGTVGYQDLDSYGTWSNEPEYGNVWQPSVSYVHTDWAPYRYGRWIWVTPWGWTWVDDAPWGYAPFHYGRWTYLRQRWCWVPGPRHIRASYAPALVGWASSPNYGADFREVGWFPLGPREIYLPARRSSWRYFHNVNAWNSHDSTALSNAYNGRNTNFSYRNRGAPHAITVIDHDAFVSARRTHGRRVNVNDDDLKHWRGQGRPPALDPNENSRLGARPTQRPPAPHLDRQSVATRHQPVTRQRVLPSLDEEAATPSAPQNDAPRGQASTRAGTTRQWSGNNVGARPGWAQPRGDQSALAPDGADQAETSANPQSRGIPMPDRTGSSNRDHADRPPHSRAGSPRLPAPVAASPNEASSQLPSDQSDQRTQHQQRQDQHVQLKQQRQAQQVEQQQQRQAQQLQQQQQRQDRQVQQQQQREAQQQARQAQQQAQQAARSRAVQPQQPSMPAPQASASSRQIVQQPQSAPLQPGESNGRTMAPQREQTQRESHGGRSQQPSPRSSNGAGPGGNGRAGGSPWQ